MKKNPNSEIDNSIIMELERLRKWIQDGTGYNKEDAVDEISRAIANRIHYIKHFGHIQNS